MGNKTFVDNTSGASLKNSHIFRRAIMEMIYDTKIPKSAIENVKDKYGITGDDLIKWYKEWKKR